MVGEFQHRTVVITGGESGIGRAAALQFAKLGARVFVGDVAQKEDNNIPFGGFEIARRICDVRSESDVESLIGDAVAATGRLDIMVNNAGVAKIGPITEATEAVWDFVMGINLKGVFFGCKHAIRQFQQTGGGVIVNTASNAGLLPRAHDPLYSISKLAVVGLTRSLALCHSRDRVRVNAVCPGPVGDTGMMDETLSGEADPEAAYRKYVNASPLAAAWGRMISPEEVAEAIVYLASDAAAMVTGTCIAIDGGKSLGVPPQAG